MFTGIISDLGTITAIEDRQALRRIRVSCGFEAASIAIGASIACGGPCLTVIAREPEGRGCWFEADIARETLERTTAGRWKEGERINLERSLKIGDELGGHIVTGHIDGLARLVKRESVTESQGDWGPTAKFTLRAPRDLSKFIAAKGSVTLDGTSLTVNDVEGDDFSVLLIPHTLAVTSWALRQAGDDLNLEVDLMARYAARLTQR